MNHSTWREAESAALANAGQQGDTLTAIPCTHGTPDACWQAANKQTHSITYADKAGRWRSLSCSDNDLSSAREHIQAEGGEIHMVDGRWAFPATEPARRTSTMSTGR